MDEFYIGKKHALYRRRENGSLSRFGIRLSPGGGLEVFDQLTRTWHRVPQAIPVRGGGSVRIIIEEGNGKDGIRQDA